MEERETLIEIHDALLLVLDVADDAPTCAEQFAESHDYVRQALVDVLAMVRERVQLIPFNARIH